MLSLNGVRAAFAIQHLAASQKLIRNPFFSFTYFPNTKRPPKTPEKFSSTLKGGKKDYTPKDEWRNYERAATPQEFHSKEEYSKIPFDPNIRHRIPNIANSLVYRALGETPWEPQHDP